MSNAAQFGDFVHLLKWCVYHLGYDSYTWYGIQIVSDGGIYVGNTIMLLFITDGSQESFHNATL